jgi:hypothetical protein
MLKNSSTFSQKEAGEDLGFMVHEYIIPMQLDAFISLL